ncbi:MAG: sugar transferase [Proteobacteria bacterium]|nr:sugar transferase [Pseudomonadota bacterium]
MFKKSPKFKYVFLLIDILFLSISLFISIYLTFPEFIELTKQNIYFGFSHMLFYLIFISIFIYAFRYNRLYFRNILVTHYRQFVLVVKSLVYGSMAGTILLAVFNVNYLALNGKELIIQNFLINLFFFTWARGVFGKILFLFLLEKNIFPQSVLIVGSEGAALYAAESFANDTISKFQVVGFLDDYKQKGELIKEDFHNLGTLEDIEEVVRSHRVNEILIAIEHAPYNRLIHIVEKCLATGLPVRIYSDLTNVIVEKMNAEYYANIPVVVLSQKPIDSREWVDKRTFDMLISALALILLSPVFLFIALGIKLSSKGPVFYKQKRIGKKGQAFSFYKFRSMHLNSDNQQHKSFVTDFIKNSNKKKEKEIKIFKITDDPRIFKFGKFIRKTSLDELPQLYNVLKGDMTLVGPRPCLLYEWECYEEWHKNRLNAIPGCTGIWQTLGRSSVTFEEMVILDLFYISNMSLWLDFQIILKTFPVIFLGKGGF